MSTIRYPSIIIIFILCLSFLSCIKNESLYQTDKLSNVASLPAEKGTQSPQCIKDTLNVLYHWKGEGGREQFLKEYAQLYRWHNQDIHLNLYDIDDVAEIQAIQHEDYLGNLSVFAANMILKKQYKWDVIPIEDVNLEPYLNDPDWLSHHFVNFKNLPEFAETHHADLTERKEMIPGPMIQGNYWTLFINNRLDSIMGLNIKQMGMTYDDFLEYVEKIDNYNRDHDTQHAIFGEIENIYRTGNVFRQLFKSAIDYTLDNPITDYCSKKQREAYLKCLKAFEQLTRFQHTPIFKFYDNDFELRKSMLLQDDCVFLVDGSWMFNVWEGIDKTKIHKIRPAEFPVFKPTKNYLGRINEVWAVFKNSPRSEYAIDFMMRMSSKDAAEDWIRLTKSPTGVIQHINTYGVGGDIYENFIHEMLEKYGTNLSYELNDIYFGRKNPRIENQNILDLLQKKYSAYEIFNRNMESIRMMTKG